MVAAVQWADMILRRSIALSGSRYGSSGLLRASFSRFSAVGFAWWNEGRLVSLVGVGMVRLLCGRLNLEKATGGVSDSIILAMVRAS
jgi:hypothetical protein